MRFYWLLTAPVLLLGQIGETPKFSDNGKFQTGTAASSLDGTAHVAAERAQINQALVGLLRAWPEAESGTRQLSAGMLDSAAEHFAARQFRPGLAVSRFLQGRTGESAEELIRLADAHPRDSRLLPLLGETIGATPDYSARLLERIRILARVHPDTEPSQFYLAQAMLRQEPPRTAEALPHLQTAARLDNTSTRALLELARQHKAAGSSGRAIAALEQAVQRDPALAVAHYRLSQLYRAAGDTEKSLFHLRCYQELQ